MEPDCRALIVERIRQRGPIPVAEYMDLALYAPGVGYYARAVQRSGRTGDFCTSVDFGPLFGTLLASRFAQMWAGMRDTGAPGAAPLDLVEAAAGNGRLSRDILDAARARHPIFYEAVALHLVERSAPARAAHAHTLARHPGRLTSSGPDLPESFAGILFANELLDALPVHVVQMTRRGLGEIYVDLHPESGRLVERLARPSTPTLAAYLEDAGITLEPGIRAEINLAALAWIGDAARRLTRGYLVLIDYGYEAAELYSRARPTGTLVTFHRHIMDAPDGGSGRGPAWLADPGSRDLTSHVDLTSIGRAAARAGLTPHRVVDQTRFLLEALETGDLRAELESPDRLQDRLALKSLLLPGGLGSTHKVMAFEKGIG